MDKNSHKLYDVDKLVADFFKQDDLKQLVTETGLLLNCPLLVLDDAFCVAAHFSPHGFSDSIFEKAVSCGEITYEVGAIISKSPALTAGAADFIKLDESEFKRRLSPLINCGVRLGYIICVDTDGHLQKIPESVWQKTETVLAKQMFIETSRQDRPFETTEEILMHLLDGGFPSEPYFRLQTAGTYLADFHPYAFALINLTEYRNLYHGDRHLKDELNLRFLNSHSFVYKGDIFLFLHSESDIDIFSGLAEEFGLKVIVSEPVSNIFELPELYCTACDAMAMTIKNSLDGSVYTVSQLRTPLMLEKLSGSKKLVLPELRALAEHDFKKKTEYCETLYTYLACSRSLKKTCDALFTHRNTVLYRIRRIQEDFEIPLDDPDKHIPLLIGSALLLFESRGPEFFLQTSYKNI